MSAVERIEAAYARNLAVQRSRLASMPEVGIFWLIDNKLVADSIPWRSRGIVNSPGVRKMILTEFNLPLAATKFEADYHYENVIPPMLDEDFDGAETDAPENLYVTPSLPIPIIIPNAAVVIGRLPRRRTAVAGRTAFPAMRLVAHFDRT
jgi:hypothetical protein